MTVQYAKLGRVPWHWPNSSNTCVLAKQLSSSSSRLNDSFPTPQVRHQWTINQQHRGMDVRCFCMAPLSPCFSDASPASPRNVHNSSPPEPGGQPCRCQCHSATFRQGLPCCLRQGCMQQLSDNWVFSTNDQSLINPSSPACARRSRNITCPERCICSPPLWLTCQIDGSGTPPLVGSWAAHSKDPVCKATDLAEHQPTPGSCAVYSLDTRSTTCQHGCCAPSLPMHYVIYSSPVSSSHLQNEGGHRFSNNVPPVLVAVYPREQGSPPHVEQLAQIDRTPTPAIPDSYLAFSGQ